ncbi:unnamed protein product [Adineta ricciae]|uniref:G-protein coupled receptors family 1 profile domain-containing protein n=1 Tax=Adineta ricciae TaxID=249248 RepID=A0A813VM21_ADIRI|nr:unnamed protein product [Adineta ricciae]
MEDTNHTVDHPYDPAKLTCEIFTEFLKNIKPSDYESRNQTREEYINKTLPPQCISRPYSGIEGAEKWVITIILFAFLIFGLLGNLLTATVMFRRSRRGLSSYFYLGLLAIIDICVLYSGCLLFMLEITFNYQPLLNALINCRIGFYTQHFFTYMSAWLIVAVTFERFLVVRYPIQSIRMCRLRVAYTVSIFLMIFFSIYTSHCFVTIKLVRINLQTNKGFHPNYTSCDLVEYRNLLSLLDLCLYSMIPSILIIVFNLLIISTMFYALKQRRNYLQASSCVQTTETCARNLTPKTKSSSSIRTQFFRSRSGESSPAARSFNPQNRLNHHGINKNNPEQKSQQALFDSTSATGIRLTCLLLIISFTFVLCTLPVSINALVAKILPEYRSTTHWQITQSSLTLFMYFNHTINFVVYCLTGRAFRSECHKLLCGLWALKDVHISCTMGSDSDKHHHYHQQIALTDRNRMNTGQQQQQRIKRSYL